MDAFSYLSVLLSIIVGLGMAQVLTALGRLIRSSDTVVWYWPPLVWAAALLVIYVQVWWSMFALRSYADWTFGTFLIVLLQNVSLYMMAAVILPEGSEDHSLDLRIHYERQSSWFFGFFAATLVISVLKEVIIAGRLPLPVNLTFHCFAFLLCTSAVVVRTSSYHKAVAVAGAGSIGLYILLLFWKLG